MLNSGSWIFLSHSSHDIDKVRLVRNEFEKLGHNPLAFHLKCLTDKTKEGKKELFDLIKREIEAREWFVFCKSPQAQKSPNVKLEHAYILKSGKDKIWQIDMTKDIDDILRDVRKICNSIEVFVSYSHKDAKLVKPLIDSLVERDYSVWTDENTLTFHGPWEQEITDAIANCSRRGFYIVVISENSMKSHHIDHELEAAISQGATIVPILLGDIPLPKGISFMLSQNQFLKIDKEQKDYTTVMDRIDATIKEKIKMSFDE